MPKRPRTREELHQQQILAAEEKRATAAMLKYDTRNEQLFERYGDTNRREIARATQTNYLPVHTLNRKYGGGVVKDFTQRVQPKPEEIGGAYGRYKLETERDPRTGFYNINTSA